MSLLDRIKYVANGDDEIVWKFPSENLAIGSQLIVNESQEAVFVKGGEVLDVFQPGTHTLTTANLPLLDKLVNLPFGGKTPFAVEVWYVNKTSKRDLKWGTPAPIPVIDPRFNYPISLRGFGQWGYRVIESRRFMTQVVGTLTAVKAQTIQSFFIGELLKTFSSALTSLVTAKNLSIFEVGSHLRTLGTQVLREAQAEFARFGVEIVNFDVVSVSIPDDEKSKIQEVMGKRMEIEQIGGASIGHAYAAVRSFDVLEKAAENPGGSVGQLLGAGLGLGVGAGVGASVGQHLVSHMSVQPPPLQQQAQQAAPEAGSPLTDRLRQLKLLHDDGLITGDEFEQQKARILGQI